VKVTQFMFIYFSVHVTSQQLSSLLTRKVIYKQVRFILNWIFFFMFIEFSLKAVGPYHFYIYIGQLDTPMICIILYKSLDTHKKNKKKPLNTVYISQYISRSSIIAMTNHMIIMVCESDSCMFVFTCIMQNRYYYICVVSVY
jgi:hypothetical protein